MANAERDQNFVPTLLGVSNADGTTPVKVYADPSTHRLLVDNAGGGTGTVTEVDTGTGLTGGPITTTGTIELDSKLAPLDTLGSAGQVPRVNAGATALEYYTPAAGTVTSVSGTTDRITSTGGATPVIDIAATYVGQSSITILGTIATGIWAGTAVAANHGGTGQTTYAKGDILASPGSDTLNKLTVGSDGQVLTADAASTNGIKWAAGGAASSITVGTTTIGSGTNTRILYDNSGVLGEYTLTGTGTVAVMQTSPTFVTDATTPVIKLSATSNQAIFQSAGVTGTLTWTPTSTNKTITFPDRTLTVDNITTSTTTNGTGFVKGNGSAISFDNSTYITGLVVGTTTIGSGTTTRILYDNAGVVGEYTLTGSGTVVAMQTAPTFLTSITTPSVLASSNDSGALGASGTAFSDLFLASGGVINWNAGNATLTHSTGLLTSNVSLSLGTSNVLTTGTIELGAASDTTLSRSSAGVLAVEGVVVDTVSATNTLTNKRITPRVLSAASYTTDTGSSINSDTQDMFIVTAQTGALKFNNPSGTPTDGQKFIISVASSTTAARALTWDTGYGATTVALPTTTAATTATLTIGFIWSASKSLWQCVAVA